MFLIRHKDLAIISESINAKSASLMCKDTKFLVDLQVFSPQNLGDISYLH